MLVDHLPPNTKFFLARSATEAIIKSHYSEFLADLINIWKCTDKLWCNIARRSHRNYYFCQAPGPGLDQPGPQPGQAGHQLGQA